AAAYLDRPARPRGLGRAAGLNDGTAGGGPGQRAGGADRGADAGPLGAAGDAAGPAPAPGSGRLQVDRAAAGRAGRLGCGRRRAVGGGAGGRVGGEGVPGTPAPTFSGDGKLSTLPSAGNGEARSPPFVNISQSRTEQILDERIAAEPLISVRWDHKVTGLAQDAAGVTLACATSGGPVALRADYVVACAGARGDEVRAMLGASFDG